MLKNAGLAGLLGTLFYLLLLSILRGTEAEFSSAPDWGFRALLIFPVLWVLWRQRINFRRLGQPWGFVSGLKLAALSGLFLVLGLASAVYVHRAYLSPEYQLKAQEVYLQNRRNQMQVNRLQKIRTEENRSSLNENDLALIESGLAKHSEQTAYFFTPIGGFYATLLYAALWSLGISLTLAYLLQDSAGPKPQKAKAP